MGRGAGCVKALCALVCILEWTFLESLRLWFPNTLGPVTLVYLAPALPSPCRCTLGLVVPVARQPRPRLLLAFADAPPRSFTNHRVSRSSKQRRRPRRRNHCRADAWRRLA